MTTETRHRLKTGLIAVNLLCSILLLVFMVGFAFSTPGETEFRIDARLSTLTVTASSNQPAWPASVPVVPAPTACAEPRFRPAPDSTIVFTRPSSGPLAVAVTGANNASAGTFRCKDGTEHPGAKQVDALLDAAAITPAQGVGVGTEISSKDDGQGSTSSGARAPSPQPFSIRFIGAVTAGAEIADIDPVPLLLESGDITMETVPLFGSTERVESTYKLNKGDVVNFASDPADGDGVKPVTFGFISDDGPSSDQPGFHLIARTRANRAMILPYGRVQAGEVAVAPDFFARARAGAKGILLGAIGALLLHVLSLILAMLDQQPPQPMRKK